VLFKRTRKKRVGAKKKKPPRNGISRDERRGKRGTRGVGQGGGGGEIKKIGVGKVCRQGSRGPKLGNDLRAHTTTLTVHREKVRPGRPTPIANRIEKFKKTQMTIGRGTSTWEGRIVTKKPRKEGSFEMDK